MRKLRKTSIVERKVRHRECGDRLRIETCAWTMGSIKKKSRNEPRTIPCKLMRFEDKQNILRKKIVKGTDIFINKNYCKYTVEYRKELWEEVKLLQK